MLSLDVFANSAHTARCASARRFLIAVMVAWAVGVGAAARFSPPSSIHAHTRGHHLQSKKGLSIGPKGLSAAANGTVRVTMERLLQTPVLSEAYSPWAYNYNAAYVPGIGADPHDSQPRDCLAVRVQNREGAYGPSKQTKGGVAASSPLAAGYAGPSSIAIMCEAGTGFPFDAANASVVLDPSDDMSQALGAEDPRVIFIPPALAAARMPATDVGNVASGVLLMFYTAVNNLTTPGNPSGNVRAQLALATCALADTPTCRSWRRHGPVFADTEVFWSKSGALLLRAGATSQQPIYLLWGDTSIFLATTTDLLHYTVVPATTPVVAAGQKMPTPAALLAPRPAPAFDAVLCESGPPPVPISPDGTLFLFLYNSARTADIPNPNPGWHLQYNLGFAVIATDPDGSTPPHVVARSPPDAPLFSPLLGWETCNDASAVPGLTPNVVFVSGMRPLDVADAGRSSNHPLGSSASPPPSEYLVYYQGCDARTGIAVLKIHLDA